MRFTSTALLAATAFALHAAAARDFIECAGPLIATNLLVGLINVVTTALSPANSVTGCPTFCDSAQGGSTTYSLYQPGLFGLLATCYCTNQQPTAFYTVAGSDASGTCATATYQVNYLGPVADQLVFSGCTTGSVPGAGSPAPFTTPNADSCFNTCQTYKYLIMTPGTGNSFTCQCASFLTTGTSATCNRNVQNIYNNAAIAPSGGALRKRREIAAEELRRENNTPCPRGYDACIIPDSEHAYECLDTSAELEACGGCVYGYWDDQLNRKANGVDCSVAPGVALGGSTCSRGKCQVTSCLYDFELKNGKCVRNFASTNSRRR